MCDAASDAGRDESRAGAVLAWYDRHRRALPWRAAPGETPDPYAVWLSEIMLQQTTVAAVKPYFAAFLKRWPDVAALARAPLEEVMRQWAGLGYYSRARNLHACARAVVERFSGRFPAEENELRSLPGLGPYTAAAVAAIAFDRPAVVVDGNIERVVARIFAVEAPPPAGKALIRRHAAEIAPHRRSGDYSQAMMDLGATICTPKQPVCAICPLCPGCAGRQGGEPARYPVKARKGVRPQRRGAVFFVTRPGGAVLLRTRPAKGLLGGMAEIPGTAWSADFDEARATELAPLPARYRRLDGAVEHVFTHFALQLSIYAGEVEAGRPAPAGCRWTAPERLEEEALPSLMRKVIEAATGQVYEQNRGLRGRGASRTGSNQGRGMGKRRAGPQIILTEGSIRVHWRDRVLTVHKGAAPPDAEDPADFVVDMDRILNWDPPHEAVEVGLDELQVIMQAIEGEFEKRGLSVAFE